MAQSRHDIGVRRGRWRATVKADAEDLSGEYALAKYRHIDADGADPATTLALLVEACDEASAEDLGWLAIVAVEPFLGRHGAEVKDAFADALRKHPKLRTAYRAAVHLPISADLERLFDSTSEPE
jgi:hypothetical protein